MRRPLTFVALVVAIALVALPAAAEQVDTQVKIVSAPGGGSVITGTKSIVVDASSSSYLKRFSVSIVPAQSDIPELNPNAAARSRDYPPGATTNDTIELSWDTRSVTPYNGVYRVVAGAESHVAGDTVSTSVDNIKVNNPPITPTGLVVDASGGAPALSWKANPEPDLIRYRVYRSVDEGNFEEIGEPTKPAFTDDNPPRDASLRYQVVALRKSPVASSIASQRSQASQPVLIASPASQSGGSGQQQQPQHQTLAEPLPAAPAPQATAAKVVLPRRDLGFAPTLPYTTAPAPALPEAESVIAAEEEPQTVLGSSATFVRESISKPPFIAAALMLLVTAMHLLRLSVRLFSKPAPSPGEGEGIIVLSDAQTAP